MSDIAIKVSNLSKVYKIGNSKKSSLIETVKSVFDSRGSVSESDFWALNDVSFDINRGEAVGIIGKNGAGKSTLLKVLSRITQPTKGRVELNGRVSSLLEVGTGFHPELTGRENIFLNGTILGMTRSEIKSKFDEIVDFSGVEKFLDTPVKRYSSGMYVRLAFAVAAHLEPEILVIDEVLAVGDVEFQKKCLGKMEQVTGAGRTVLFVSHNMGAVRNLCTKGVMLKNGEVQIVGNVESCIESYLSDRKSEGNSNINYSNEFIKLEAISVDQEHEEVADTVDSKSPVQIVVKYKILKKISPLRIKIQLFKGENMVFHTDDTVGNAEFQNREVGEYVSSLTIPANFLNNFEYDILLGIDSPGYSIFLPFTPIKSFKVIDTSGVFKYDSNWPGIIRPYLPWKVVRKDLIEPVK